MLKIASLNGIYVFNKIIIKYLQPYFTYPVVIIITGRLNFIVSQSKIEYKDY